MSLKVTEVRFRIFERENLLGFADITFNDSLVVKGWKLMNSKNGEFLGSPSVYNKRNDDWDNIAFVLDEADREDVLDAVMEEREKEAKKPKRGRRDSSRRGNRSSRRSRSSSRRNEYYDAEDE